MTIESRQAWFNISITAGLGPAASQKVGRYLHDHRLDASELAEFGRDDLQHRVGLSAGVASSLHDQLHDVTETPQVPAGVELLTPGDDHFPNHRFLDANPPLPPVLWATAYVPLLSHSGPALAVAGSRETTEEILQVVEGIARNAGRQGWLVVSGLAPGVDSAAHSGAVAGPVGTVGVLASGILRAAHSWAPYEIDGLCVVSQFAPHDPWSGPRAMQRNSVIAALADRVLVAAAGTSGGSWEMAQLCLKRRKPLFVLDVDDQIAPGNRKLIRAGAIAVDPSAPEALLEEREGPPMTLFG